MKIIWFLLLSSFTLLDEDNLISLAISNVNQNPTSHNPANYNKESLKWTVFFAKFPFFSHFFGKQIETKFREKKRQSLKALIGLRVGSWVGMVTFSFFRKTIVSLWKRRQKIENETIVFKTIVNEERKPTWRASVFIIE